MARNRTRRPHKRRNIKPAPATSNPLALSDDGMARLRLGLSHHQAGRLQDAADAYEQVLALAPDNPDANHLLGVVAHQAGQSTLAVELITKAIIGKSDDAAYHSNLGNAQRATSDTGAAETSYKRALELTPNDFEVHNNLGNLYSDQEQLEAAVSSYETAIKLNNDYPQAHNNLGVVLQKQGDLTAAESQFREALRLTPGYADAANNLGDVLQSLGRAEAATACYRDALGGDANNAAAHNNLATMLQGQGDMAGAAEHFRKAVQLKPDFHQALSNLGHLLEDQGQSRNAVACYQDAFQARTGIEFDGDTDLAPGNVSLFLELTNKCNFHCEFCPSDSQSRAIGFMDLSLAKRMIDETADKGLATQILLHLMGEPTLHPKLTEILGHAAGRKLKTELVTNGSALVAKTIPKILDNLYGTVIASLMTPTPGSYVTRGDVGLKWDRYIDNFRLLVRHHLERLYAGTPFGYAINIRVMVTNESRSTVDFLESADEVQALWCEWCGVVEDIEEELGLTPFPRPDVDADSILRTTGTGGSPSYHLQRGLELTFWSAFTFANTRVGEAYELHTDETQTERFCKHPWLDVGVLWNGDVTFCCMDYDSELKVGNVGDGTLEAVMTGEAAAALRKSMFKLDTLPAYCRQCQARPVLPGEVTSDDAALSSDMRSQ
jgi:radical SAM protein with 4Fe4S-binding SPASM domain